MDSPREPLQALASSTRMEILRALREKELHCADPENCDLSTRCCSVGELTDRLNLSQPTVSHHLKELRRAGLITTHKEGRTAYCGLNRETFEELQDFMGSFVTEGRNASCN